MNKKGISTLISQVMFFSFMLAVLVGVFIITKSNLLEDDATMDLRRDSNIERMNTRIDIENVTYSVGTTTVLVRNQGSTTMRTTLIDFYFNGDRIERNSTSLSISVIAPDITNPTLWDPDEVIQITYDNVLSSGNYTLNVVTEFSIMDAKIFEVT